MSGLLSKYIQWMSLAGFFVLMILSIMSFTNMEFLKIKEGRNVASGIILLVISIVYGLIGCYLIYRENKLEEATKKNSEHTEVRSLNNIQGNGYTGVNTENQSLIYDNKWSSLN